MQLVDSFVQAIRKHSPKILLGAGVVGVFVGTVLACKETRKIDPILAEHKDTLNDIHMAADTGIIVDKETSNGVPYSEKDKRRDLTVCYAKTAVELGKLYLPSFLVLTGSVGCIAASHSILQKRNIGLTAAYAGVSQAFDEYRKNIVEKFGEGADAEARYSIKAKKHKSKDGEELEYEVTENTAVNDHSKFFDCGSRFWDNNVNLNLMFIRSIELSFNRKLKYRKSHIVTLNEIYDALDLEPVKDGQVLGYKYDPGKDTLVENGNEMIPNKIQIAIYQLTDKNRRILRTVDEVIQEGRSETVMLLDFPGLETII